MSGKSARTCLLSGKQSAMAAPGAARPSEQLGQAPVALGDIFVATTTTTTIGLPARAASSAPQEGAHNARNAAERSPRMRASVEAALQAPARLAIAGVPLLAGAAARARVPKRSTKLLLLLLVFVELFVRRP